MMTFNDKIHSKKLLNFSCEKCNFMCSNKQDYTRHLSTGKHKMMTNNDEQNSKEYRCVCGKKYKHRQGLSIHKQKCLIKENINSSENFVLDTGIVIDKQTIMAILLQNREMMTKMMEIMPQVGNQTTYNNINHNTMNNQLNIQMFLNEHCKNAMNLTDFIDSLPITAETYDSTIENGLTKTIMNMLVNGLSQLDILDRPIHCTDASRKTLYVKDDNTWEKDNELLHILKGIKTLSVKQRTMLNKWQDANMGWATKENLQSRMTKLVFNSMTSIENDDKETGKIIRAISKNVYLDTDTKDQYIQSK